MKRIFHIADIHVRPLDRIDEYRAVFTRFIEILRAEKPSDFITVIAGDVFDKKDTLKPESLMLVREFLFDLSKICPVVMIAGNHDILENRQSRLDMLTPTAHCLNVHYLRNSGVSLLYGISFVVYSLLDKKPVDISAVPAPRIALYHGSLQGATTDGAYVVKGQKTFLPKNAASIFDLVLLGDIHKRQFLAPNMAYSGSFIQQNFGEKADGHGYIEWDIAAQTGVGHDIPNDFSFVEVVVNDGKWDAPVVTKNTYLKVKVASGDAKEALAAEKAIAAGTNVVTIARVCTARFAAPFDIVSRDDESIFRKAIEAYSVTDVTFDKIFGFHRRLKMDLGDENLRTLRSWRPLKLAFRNAFSYGGDITNEIDFDKLTGVTAICGENASGKTNILKTIMFTLFHRWVTKRAIITNKNETDYEIDLRLIASGTLLDVHKAGKGAKVNGVETNKHKISLTVTEKGEQTDSMDSSRECTDTLAEYIGSYESFLLKNVYSNTLMLSPFTMDDSDLFAHMARLFGLDIYEKLKQKAVVTKKTVDELLVKVRAKIDALPEAIDLPKVEKSLTGRISRLAAAETALVAADTEARGVDEKLKELYTSFDPELPAFAGTPLSIPPPSETLAELSTQLVALERQESALDGEPVTGEMSELDRIIAELTARSVELSATVRTCGLSVSELERSQPPFAGPFDAARFAKLEALPRDSPVSAPRGELVDKKAVLEDFLRSKPAIPTAPAVSPAIATISEYLAGRQKCAELQSRICALSHEPNVRILQDIDSVKEGPIVPLLPTKVFSATAATEQTVVTALAEKLKSLTAGKINPSNIDSYIELLTAGKFEPAQLEPIIKLLREIKDGSIDVRYKKITDTSLKLQKAESRLAEISANEAAVAENETRRASNAAIQSREFTILQTAFSALSARLQTFVNASHEQLAGVKAQLSIIARIDEYKELLRAKAYAEHASKLATARSRLSRAFSSLKQCESAVEQALAGKKALQRQQELAAVRVQIREIGTKVRFLRQQLAIANDRIRADIAVAEALKKEKHEELMLAAAEVPRLKVLVGQSREKICREKERALAAAALSGEETSYLAALTVINRYLMLIDGRNIPSMLMADKLADITVDTNKILAKLSALSMTISIDEDSARKRIMFEVEKDDVVLDVKQLSGYETFVSNLALKIALNKHCLCGRSGLFCIDEGLDCIDDLNFEKLEQLFTIMRSEFTNVLVITHLSKIKRYVDDIIQVENPKGYSVIKN